MTDYADLAERDAAIAKIKQQCRDMVKQIKTHLGPTGISRLTAMPVWIDGVWGDYWYVELDGEEVGEIRYDGYGPVVKGDALSTLAYRAGRTADLAAESR